MVFWPFMRQSVFPSPIKQECLYDQENSGLRLATKQLCGNSHKAKAQRFNKQAAW